MIAAASLPIDSTAQDPETGLTPTYIVKPEVIYCSDSIAVSTPASNYDAMWLCEAATKIQTGICAHELILLWAITTGNLYHSGNTIFGPAIANVVALEKTEWRPVVVVSKDTLESFEHTITKEDREIVGIRRHQLVLKEDVEEPCVDPFRLVKAGVDQKNLHPDTRMRIDLWRVRIRIWT